MAHAQLWTRLEAAVAAIDGQLVPLEADASISLYNSPKNPRRAAALTPPTALVTARRPAAHAAFLEAHGAVLVGLPRRCSVPSFALLPARAAAQLTSATGEHKRPWSQVVAEREAGKSNFAWIMFAAWDVSDVHGWAFDLEGRVWIVEDGAPVKPLGSFEAWLEERVEKLERAAEGEEEEEEEDEDDEEEEEDDEDDGALAPSSLDEL